MKMDISNLETQINKLIDNAAKVLITLDPIQAQICQDFITDMNNIKLRAQMFACGMKSKEILAEMSRFDRTSRGKR